MLLAWVGEKFRVPTGAVTPWCIDRLYQNSTVLLCLLLRSSLWFGLCKFPFFSSFHPFHRKFEYVCVKLLVLLVLMFHSQVTSYRYLNKFAQKVKDVQGRSTMFYTYAAVSTCWQSRRLGTLCSKVLVSDKASNTMFSSALIPLGVSTGSVFRGVVLSLSVGVSLGRYVLAHWNWLRGVSLNGQKAKNFKMFAFVHLRSLICAAALTILTYSSHQLASSDEERVKASSKLFIRRQMSRYTVYYFIIFYNTIVLLLLLPLPFRIVQNQLFRIVLIFITLLLTDKKGWDLKLHKLPPLSISARWSSSLNASQGHLIVHQGHLSWCCMGSATSHRLR